MPDTEAALSCQLVRDPECWSSQGLNPRPPARESIAVLTEPTGHLHTWFNLQPQDSLSDGNNNQEHDSPPVSQSMDIEDVAGKGPLSAGRPVATKRKRVQMTLGDSLSRDSSSGQQNGEQTSQLSQTWKEVLGEPPKWGPNKVWLCKAYQRELNNNNQINQHHSDVMFVRFHLNGYNLG